MTWAVAPADAPYVTLSVPGAPTAKGTVTPFARLSLSGKFRVEVPGASVPMGPREKKPGAVWPATVRLPVTAIAVLGMFLVESRGRRFVTLNVWNRLAVKDVGRPLADLESTMRFGVTVT